ncbi:MAG: hypothetical protein ACN6OD_16470 [Alcaligenes sp.]
MKPERSHAALGSLRSRLLLGTLAWILVSIVLAGLGLNRLFQDHVYRQFEQRLQTHLDQIMADVNLENLNNLSLQSRLSDPLFEQPYSGMYWQIARREATGGKWTVALRSTSLWDEALDANAAGSAHGSFTLQGPAKQPLIVLRQELDEVNDKGQSLQIMVAGSRELLAEPLERFQRILFLSLGGLALGLILAAVLQVVLALYPLQLLRRRLLDVQEGRQPEIGGRFPSEIQPLVDDFNAVLHANARMVDRARAQAGNLAHAVRTPLTIMGNAAAGADPQLAAVVSEQGQGHGGARHRRAHGCAGQPASLVSRHGAAACGETDPSGSAGTGARIQRRRAGSAGNGGQSARQCLQVGRPACLVPREPGARRAAPGGRG